jgi:superfamily II DNA or RNA helicase
VLDFLSRLSAPVKPEPPLDPVEPVEEKAESNEPSPFEGMQFRHPLRKYQQEILELTRRKFSRGERALHIVAPPGAGKTIIGLQIVCELKEPALIISPTTTIQAQWGEKLGLFLPPGADPSTEHLIGTHEDKPLKPITLLTYQVLSTTSREQEYLEKLAHQAWVDELVAGTSNSMGSAELRIVD